MATIGSTFLNLIDVMRAEGNPEGATVVDIDQGCHAAPFLWCATEVRVRCVEGHIAAITVASSQQRGLSQDGTGQRVGCDPRLVHYGNQT